MEFFFLSETLNFGTENENNNKHYLQTLKFNIMSYSFRLVAKRDIRGDGKVIMGKGMSIEHVEPVSGGPQQCHVEAMLKQRYNVSKIEFGGSLTFAFEIER